MANIPQPNIKYISCCSIVTFITNNNVGILAIAAQIIEFENEATYSNILSPESGLIIIYQYIKNRVLL